MEIKFVGVSKRYGRVAAVQSLDLTIESGALHFLLGPSGCGKTTILRMLAGLEPVSDGRILFGGKDVTKMPAAERGIGMVFQNYALWPHMTVLENIEYGLKVKKLGAAEIKARADEVLNITQLTQYAERLPGQLSGGQQQRVALARALAIRPNVLLLDEPLSNLDAKLRLEMRDNISRIHRKTGITTVYVTHDQKESLSMGTAVSVMRAGHLIQTDTPRRLYYSPRDSFIAGFIGETNLIRGMVSDVSGTRTTVKTALGNIAATRTAKAFGVGSDVMVSIRPEVVHVMFPGITENSVESQDITRMNLHLDQLVYLGENEQFLFHGTDGHSLRASVFNPPPHTLKEGDSVTCVVKTGDVLVLPAADDLSSGT